MRTSFRWQRLITLAALAFTSAISAAVLSSQSPLTLFDEIDDAAERAEFRKAWEERRPDVQRALAIDFAERFPGSIVLREAFELAARSSFSLSDHRTGLDWAQRSLRLLPENPVLLVIAADGAARDGQFDLAERYARDGLRYLTNALGPGGVSSEDWKRSRETLRATAYFVLGRVAAEQGRFADARRSLLMALSLDQNDVEALYVLGVVQMALGDDANAAAAFARARETPGPLAAAADESLRTLHARSSRSITFEQFVASSRWTPPQPAARAASPPAGEYAGSESCRTCHSRIYDSWRATGMSKMFRPYRAEDVFGDFAGKATISAAARPVVEGGRHFFEIREGDTGRWIRYPVDYVIGSKWQQAYATRLADSRVAVFPIQYSRKKQTWLNYWNIVDAPGSDRTDISKFHQVPDGTSYETSCAACHTSQLKSPMVFREGGVNCEMCHGPSLDHATRMKSGAAAARSSYETPLAFDRLSAEQSVAVCAQCHAQSAVHDVQPGGAVNYSEQMPFVRAYPTHLASDFSRQAFYRDGRHRATTFISEAFARSACFRKGNATCTACHDPHPPDAASNPTSLKFLNDPNRMCVQCHTPFAERPEAHTRHVRQSEGSKCVSCHMPPIMDALLFPSRTHEIDDIPDAAMTARFGQKNSPNACLMCHEDRDVEWLQREMLKF